MKTQISKFYGDYGKYINRYRSFPLIYDGLKIVERRILYSMWERAKDHLVKSAEVCGWCVGQYHPHSDASVYGSLAVMVNRGLIVGQGNWGCDTGIVSDPPAAARYTECKSKKEVLDMAFEYIKYVKMEPLELKDEPVFFPSKLPFCLIGPIYTQGIGFGSRTLIPTYTVKDLVKRLKWLLGYEKTEPIIRPVTDCLYISKDKDFQELLTTGKGKIEFRGKAQKDFGNKCINVVAIPPNKSFQKILSALSDEIEVQKTIAVLDESTNVTKVRFTSTKKSLTLDALEKKINSHLVGSITFECNMCDLEGNIVLVSPDQMLLNVYRNYEQVVNVVLKSEINKIQKEINELKLIAKIKLVLPKWLKSNPDDVDIVIDGVATDTAIPKETIIEIFNKYTLSRILKIKTDIEGLESEKIKIQFNLTNLQKYVWDDKFDKLLT